MKNDELLSLRPYSLNQTQKRQALLPNLIELTKHHVQECPMYAKMVSAVFPNYLAAKELSDLPFLPVQMFKTHNLKSIADQDVYKVMTSSGTTGQAVSKIYLNETTAALQSKALSVIVKELVGGERIPMLLIESPNLIKDRAQFSARGAGLLGMLPFGRNHTYVLDDTMQLDENKLFDFLKKFGSDRFLIFGFTFMVWKYFFQRIENKNVDLANGLLIHSGGWKKLADEAVTNDAFNLQFRIKTGLSKIHNFYGMVEQVGSVFMSAEDGFFYPPAFADIIIRDPYTWEPLPNGQTGLVQVLSTLPMSYPGHSILTEDLGVIHTADTSSNGWLGKGFSILGRVPNAELRGCSDTHAAEGAH